MFFKNNIIVQVILNYGNRWLASSLWRSSGLWLDSWPLLLKPTQLCHTNVRHLAILSPAWEVQTWVLLIMIRKRRRQRTAEIASTRSGPNSKFISLSVCKMSARFVSFSLFHPLTLEMSLFWPFLLYYPLTHLPSSFKWHKILIESKL